MNENIQDKSNSNNVGTQVPNILLDSTKVLSENNTEVKNNTSSANTNNINVPQNQPSQTNSSGSGFFSNIWNKVKSWWIIEEEEYIDAHGFKAKRPKTKIPLRNQKDAMENEAKYEGGEGLAYASQHSPFGRMFL